jgi:hypothetical protein
MRRWLRFVVAGVAATAVAAACSGDAPEERFVASSLRQVPAASVGDNTLVTLGDVDVAGRLADVERPGSGNESDYGNWLLELEGTLPDGTVSVIWPRLFRVPQVSEVEGEIGFSLADVGSFVEAGDRPAQFVILRGIDTNDIDDALGTRVDGLWQAGESEETNLDDITPLRPIGTALFLGERDGRIIVGEQRDTVVDWLEGDGESMMDNDAIASVARRLDDAKVYSAMIASRSDPLESPGSDGVDIDVAPWSVLAIGLLPGDDRVAVIVYHHDNEDDAQANAEVIEDQFADGVSIRTNEPWSDRLEVRSVDVSGTDVVVELQLDRVDLLFEALVIGEPVLTAGLGR